MKKFVKLLCFFILGFTMVNAETSRLNNNSNLPGLTKLEDLFLCSVGDKKVTRPELPLLIEEYKASWITEDQNLDGKIDYAVSHDKKGLKLQESYDYDSDGAMDDFYYYLDGILVKREIDSNFDGNIDLWVYIYKGNYIRAYEKDRDFDGIIDVVKQY